MHDLGIGLTVDRIGEHRQRADGSLQLVGDVRDEVGAHRVGTHPLAHVLGGDHRTAGGQGFGLDRQPRARRAVQLDEAGGRAHHAGQPPDSTRCAPPRARRCACPARSWRNRCGTRSSPSANTRRRRCRGAAAHRGTAPTFSAPDRSASRRAMSAPVRCVRAPTGSAGGAVAAAGRRRRPIGGDRRRSDPRSDADADRERDAPDRSRSRHSLGARRLPRRGRIVVALGVGPRRHPAADDVLRAVTHVHGVIADPLVEPGHHRELDRHLQVDVAGGVTLEDDLDELPMEVVEVRVHVARARPHGDRRG